VKRQRHRNDDGIERETDLEFSPSNNKKTTPKKKLKELMRKRALMRRERP
jgi:hypothetical protein